MSQINIDELEAFFNSIELPETLVLNDYTKIVDVKRMVRSHLVYLKYNKGNKLFMPYYERLKLVYGQLNKN